MAQDKNTLRRRAATLVLGNLLDDDALAQALWMQHEKMRGDAVSDIITFIDAVGERNLFDAPTRRRLYTEFYQALRLPDDQLPLDPLPMMQVVRATTAPPPIREVTSPLAAGFTIGVPAPMMVAPVVAAAPQAAAPALPPAPRPELVAVPAPVPVSAVPVPPPEQPVVFGALMRSVLKEVGSVHRDAFAVVRQDALIELERSRVPVELRAQVRQAWAAGIHHDWRLSFDLQVLGELVRVLHATLTTAFGRAGADQILSRAVRAADELPQARRCPPRRLLHLL